jgi:hypothetical protein
MADTKLSALTSAAALALADLFYVVQGGTGKKASGTQIKTLVQDGAYLSPGYVAGLWYVPYGITSLSAGGALPQNSIRLLPCIIPATVTIKGLGARVTTVGTTNVQLALYANDPALNRPTGTAIVSTGNLANTGTGPVGATGNVTQATLSPGIYWMAINNNDATCALVTQNIASPLMTQLCGSTAFAINTGAASAWHLSFAQTFGTWPDLTAQVFTEVNASNTATNQTAVLDFIT